MRETALSWATISRAKRGESVDEATAQKLSDFTQGRVAARLMTAQGAVERARLIAREERKKVRA